jgi:hypothetical protein
MFITGLGAVFFGLVIGWISYRTLRLTAGTNLLLALDSMANRSCSFGRCLLWRLHLSPRQVLLLRMSSKEGEGRAASCPTQG